MMWWNGTFPLRWYSPKTHAMVRMFMSSQNSFDEILTAKGNGITFKGQAFGRCLNH